MALKKLCRKLSLFPILFKSTFIYKKITTECLDLQLARKDNLLWNASAALKTSKTVSMESIFGWSEMCQAESSETSISCPDPFKEKASVFQKYHVC